MFQPTIRVRLILWFGLMVTAIVFVFSFVTYHTFRATLFSDMDGQLKLKAIGIINYIDAYWTSWKIKGEELGEDPRKFAKFNSINFVQIADTWIDVLPLDPELADISVSIFSDKGQLFASSKNFIGPHPLSKEAVAAAVQGKTVFSEIVDAESSPAKRLRVLTVPVSEDNSLICILQLAKSLAFVENALDELRNKQLFFLPLSLVLVIITGGLLADVILRPLTGISQTVRQISAERLSSRVKVPAAKDGIRLLAETFNDMLEKLEQAFAMQKQIVQDVSHELRTPLTILKGEIEVALKKVRSRDEYQSTLVSSLEEIDRINRMVENLLFLARFDSRQLALELRPVALGELLAELIADMRLLASAKHITLAGEGAAATRINADQGQLRRALLNIIDNAIKYTPESGAVSVSLQSEEGWAVIRVTDTGAGIEPQRLPFVFDRFYRADASRTSTGFGLGLSIAKAIIEAHQGEITLTSEFGSGTVVAVFLPLPLPGVTHIKIF